jgi:hypothetical protein
VDKIDAFVKWIGANYLSPFLGTFAVLFLAMHFYSKKTLPAVLQVLMIVVTVAFFVVLSIDPAPIALGEIGAVLFLYGTMLFILLSTILQSGVAAWLTRKRGEKWVKELDYIYLSIGSVGVLATLNGLPFITHKIDAGDLMAPVILTTAIVIRFIKTRAEIAGWHKV